MTSLIAAQLAFACAGAGLLAAGNDLTGKNDSRPSTESSTCSRDVPPAPPRDEQNASAREEPKSGPSKPRPAWPPPSELIA